MVKLPLGNRLEVNAMGGFTARRVGTSVEVIRLLVERGANGNVGARDYECVLAAAREEGCGEMVGQ